MHNHRSRTQCTRCIASVVRDVPSLTSAPISEYFCSPARAQDAEFHPGRCVASYTEIQPDEGPIRMRSPTQDTKRSHERMVPSVPRRLPRHQPTRAVECHPMSVACTGLQPRTGSHQPPILQQNPGSEPRGATGCPPAMVAIYGPYTQPLRFIRDAPQRHNDPQSFFLATNHAATPGAPCRSGDSIVH